METLDDDEKTDEDEVLHEPWFDMMLHAAMGMVTLW